MDFLRKSKAHTERGGGGGAPVAHKGEFNYAKFWLIFTAVTVLLVSVGVYVLLRAFNLDISNAESIRAFVQSFGALAPIVFIVLIVIQGIIPPIPSGILIIAGGYVFGTFAGFVCALLGEFLVAVFCFTLSQWFGRPFVEKLIDPKELKAADKFFKKIGPKAIFLSRLIPLISFDVVSYAAGLTRIRFSRYLVATVLGMIPRLLLLTWFGDAASGLMKTVGILLTLLVGVSMLVFPIFFRKSPARDKAHENVVEAVKHSEKVVKHSKRQVRKFLTENPKSLRLQESLRYGRRKKRTRTTARKKI